MKRLIALLFAAPALSACNVEDGYSPPPPQVRMETPYQKKTHQHRSVESHQNYHQHDEPRITTDNRHAQVHRHDQGSDAPRDDYAGYGSNGNIHGHD